MGEDSNTRAEVRKHRAGSSASKKNDEMLTNAVGSVAEQALEHARKISREARARAHEWERREHRSHSDRREQP